MKSREFYHDKLINYLTDCSQEKETVRSYMNEGLSRQFIGEKNSFSNKVQWATGHPHVKE